jgi:hypothetical protein
MFLFIFKRGFYSSLVVWEVGEEEEEEKRGIFSKIWRKDHVPKLIQIF